MVPYGTIFCKVQGLEYSSEVIEMNNELFETMPVPKAYMKLALPVMMSSVLMLVYNMVDMYFIARTGNTNLCGRCRGMRAGIHIHDRGGRYAGSWRRVGNLTSVRTEKRR